jgi:hypothetical protein
MKMGRKSINQLKNLLHSKILIGGIKNKNSAHWPSLPKVWIFHGTRTQNRIGLFGSDTFFFVGSGAMCAGPPTARRWGFSNKIQSACVPSAKLAERVSSRKVDVDDLCAVGVGGGGGGVGRALGGRLHVVLVTSPPPLWAILGQVAPATAAIAEAVLGGPPPLTSRPLALALTPFLAPVNPSPSLAPSIPLPLPWVIGRSLVKNRFLKKILVDFPPPAGHTE